MSTESLNTVKSIEIKPKAYRYKRPKDQQRFCLTCQIELNDSNWSKSLQTYVRNMCNPCYAKRQRNYAKRNPNGTEKRREGNKRWLASLSEVERERQRDIRYSNWIRRKYGLTIEEYNLILSKQDNKCGVCQSPRSTGKGRFHVDHCHTTNKIRGLLCSKCNTMLGQGNDSTEIFERAIAYINKHSQEQ